MLRCGRSGSFVPTIDRLDYDDKPVALLIRSRICSIMAASTSRVYRLVSSLSAGQAWSCCESRGVMLDLFAFLNEASCVACPRS